MHDNECAYPLAKHARHTAGYQEKSTIERVLSYLAEAASQDVEVAIQGTDEDEDGEENELVVPRVEGYPCSYALLLLMSSLPLLW